MSDISATYEAIAYVLQYHEWCEGTTFHDGEMQVCVGTKALNHGDCHVCGQPLEHTYVCDGCKMFDKAVASMPDDYEWPEMP